jgi:hypothetical protein
MKFELEFAESPSDTLIFSCCAKSHIRAARRKMMRERGVCGAWWRARVCLRGRPAGLPSTPRGPRRICSQLDTLQRQTPAGPVTMVTVQ